MLAYLQQLADIFGLGTARFVQLLAQEGITRGSSGMPPRDAFAILGVAPNAPEQVVKQTYRDLMRAEHPDTIAAQGLDAAALAAANDRVAALNMAYAEIKRVRGWV